MPPDPSGAFTYAFAYQGGDPWHEKSSTTHSCCFTTLTITRAFQR